MEDGLGVEYFETRLAASTTGAEWRSENRAGPSAAGQPGVLLLQLLLHVAGGHWVVVAEEAFGMWETRHRPNADEKGLVANWLAQREAGAGHAGVVIGCDARHRSAEFADEAAAVLAGAGIRVLRLPSRQPTPLLAFAVRHLHAAAGIMITASHNPPADNGYKLYLADGAQIIPPADAEIEAATRALGPLAGIPVAPPGSPLIEYCGDQIAVAYLDAICRGSASLRGRPPWRATCPCW